MADAVWRIFGSEMSPYSVKVRSYFRFKGVPHQWVPRTTDNEAEYKRFAKLPIVPTVASPDEEGLQDSTPILEALEARFPEPAIHPQDPDLAFLSALIEEFGDEWGNKPMFHYRWSASADADKASRVLPLSDCSSRATTSLLRLRPCSSARAFRRSCRVLGTFRMVRVGMWGSREKIKV